MLTRIALLCVALATVLHAEPEYPKMGADIYDRSVDATPKIAAAVELVIQISRLSNGQRRVVSVTEVTGVRDNQCVLNELYSFDLDTSHFVAVNVVPCNPKLRDLVANNKWL